MTEIRSNQLFYYSITDDNSNFVSVNMELDEQIDEVCMERAVRKTSKKFPYLNVRLAALEDRLVLEENDAPVRLYHDDGCSGSFYLYESCFIHVLQ